MLRIVWLPAARRRMRRLDAVTRARIAAAVARFATDNAGDVVPLVNRPGLRLRVGDWRVLFTVDDVAMYVERVSPRGDAYR